jgi:hypothetical protein
MRLLFMFVGLVFVGLAVPLIRRRVRPNGLYGLRIPATFANESIWYEANAKSGRDFLWLGIALIVLAVTLPVIGVRGDAYALGWCAAAVIGSVGVAIVGWRRANRLLRDRQADGEQT